MRLNRTLGFVNGLHARDKEFSPRAAFGATGYAWSYLRAAKRKRRVENVRIRGTFILMFDSAETWQGSEEVCGALRVPMSFGVEYGAEISHLYLWYQSNGGALRTRGQ